MKFLKVVLKLTILYSPTLLAQVQFLSGDTHLQLAEAKKAVNYCMTSYPNGLLTKIAFEIYGEEFFKYDEKSYLNYGYTHGYKTDVRPLFKGDTNTSWGLSLNPEYISINSVTHDFVSFIDYGLSPSLHFLDQNSKGSYFVDHSGFSRDFPEISFDIFKKSKKDSFGVAVPNSEEITNLSIKFDPEMAVIKVQDKEIEVSFADYSLCFISEIHKLLNKNK